MPLETPSPFMVPPPCMELRESHVASHCQGVFCKQSISRDTKFGPFVGEIIAGDDVDKKRDEIDFRFAWHVINNETGKVLHVINATVPSKGNWMRYVNCARFFEEQNIVSVQEGSEIYYKALKDIQPGEELLTWFDPPDMKKTRRRKRGSRAMSATSVEMGPPSVQSSASQQHPPGNGKRLRKKKVSADMLSLDDDDVIFASSGLHHNRIRNNVSSGLRRSSSLPDGKMMGGRKIEAHRNKTSVSGYAGNKMVTSTSQQTNALRTGDVKIGTIRAQSSQPVKPRGPKPAKTLHQIVDSLKSAKQIMNNQDVKAGGIPTSPGGDKSTAGLIVPTISKHQQRSSLVGTAEYMEEHLTTNYQFLFEVTATHKSVPKGAPKRVRYACDICEGQYRKPVSLKRHYLREHINHKYLSKDDISLLNHKVITSTDKVEADVDPDADDLDASENSNDANEVKIKTEAIENELGGDTKDALKSEEEINKEAVQHSTEGSVSTVSLPASKPKLDRAAQENSLKSKAMEGKMTFSFTGTDGVDDAFRCYLCVQLFSSVEKLKYHVTHDSHRSKGDKQFACDRCGQRFRFHHNYQRHIESHGTNMGELSTACHVCGKKFLNEANMRKHLRFHSGRNFPCKYGCDVVYPNVAELVKHLRALHPELPKKSQQVPTKAADVQKKRRGRQPKSSEPEVSTSQTVLVEHKIKSEAEAIQDFESSHPPGWIETRGRKPRPGIVGVHCTICKKKFSTYGSMCRHRRSVHRVVKQFGEFRPVDSGPSSSPLPAGGEEAEAWDDPVARRVLHIEASVEKMYQAIEAQHASNSTEDEELIFSPPPSPTSFYRNVADNIAENLSLYLDGGSEALKTAQQHVREEDVPSDEAQSASNVDWSVYNFPQFFMPVDPVIPHPPARPPPLPPTHLSFEGEKAPAYPTRSAVAEREASRRASVGTVEKQKSGVTEKMVRRASVSALDSNVDGKEKIARRASVGSYDNPKAKETDEVSTEVADREFTVCEDSKTELKMVSKLSQQNGELDATKPNSLSPNQAPECVVSAESLESESEPAADLVQEVDAKRSKLVEKSHSVSEDLDEVFDSLSDVTADDRMEKRKNGSGMESAQLPGANGLQGEATGGRLKNVSGMENAHPPDANAPEVNMTGVESTQELTGSDAATSQGTSSTCTDRDIDKLYDNPPDSSVSSPVCEQRLLGEIVSDAGKCVLDTDDKMEEDADMECSGPDPLQNDSFRDSDLPSETSDSIKSTLSEQSDLQTSTNSNLVAMQGCDKSAIDECACDTKTIKSDRPSSASASPGLAHSCSLVTEVVSKEDETLEEPSCQESYNSVCSRLPPGQSLVCSMQEGTHTAAPEMHGVEESVHRNAKEQVLANNSAVPRASAVADPVCGSVKQDEMWADDNVEMGEMSTKEHLVTEVDPAATVLGVGQSECVPDVSKGNSDDNPDALSQGKRSVGTAENGAKESTSKSEHNVPPIISKSSESSVQNTPIENSTLDLGEKELEYLSKGAVFYVRGNQKRCPHILKKVGIPARPLENEAEENYVSMLELTVKKVDPSCVVKCPNGEEMATASEPTQKKADPSCAAECLGDKEMASVSDPVLSAQCGQHLGKIKQDPNQPHSSKEDSHKSQHANVPDAVFTAVNASDAASEQREQDHNLPEVSEGIPCEDTHVGASKTVLTTVDQDELEVSRARSGDPSKMTMTSEGSLQTSPNSRSDVDSHADPMPQSSSCSGQLQSASNHEDSDLDLEIVDCQAKLKLQALQERITIDRDALDMCERCRPQSTEHSEPSKRSAEDFMKMRFGRKYEVYSVCSMCRRYYHGVDSLLRHQWKKHPSIQCSHIEVENGHGLETLFYPEPSSHGVLAQSVLLPPEHLYQDSYTCTRCKLTVRQYSRLRTHILNCDPNTPTTPHTRKKKPKTNRHRFMEKMLPDSESKVEKPSGFGSAIRDLNFKSKLQGSMGSRVKTLHSTSSSHRQVNSLSRTEFTRSSYPHGGCESSTQTHAKSHHWKFSQSQSGPASSTSGFSHEIVGCRVRKRRNYELLYNPSAHVRRREKTECLEIHQCQGCGLKFKTLSLLERHTKNCSGREKLLSQKPVVNKLLEGHGGKKHSCHYCPKHFKYLKGVYNHYNNNFCRVRAQRMSSEGLSAQDQSHEAELEASLQQQAWNKMENRDHTDVIQGRAHLHDDGTITHTKRKGGWPKGLKRSNKRRRHCWTYIKRRKLDGSGSETASSPGKKHNSSTCMNSAVSSSSSATSAAMSELEAQLREPVVRSVRVKKLNKEPVEVPEHTAKPQATKHADPCVAPEQSPTGKAKGKKLSQALEDLSQAPVIDRMDPVPPAKPRDSKQMSPDLEPPVLSPISSLASPTRLSNASAQGKRKRKGKSGNSGTLQSKKKKAGGADTMPLAVKADSPAVLVPQMNPANGQVVFMPQGNQAEGMTAPIFVLEQVTDASGAKVSQYKLVQLKIPTVTPRLPHQVSLLQQVTGAKAGDQNSSSSLASPASLSIHSMEQKPLPPNFLFPPPAESAEQEEGKSAVNTAAGNSPDGNGQVTRSRKGKPRKRGTAGNTPAPPTINTLFKNRKSPTRANANTLKNMDAYRYEKSTISTASSNATLPASAISSTAAVPTTSSTSKVPASTAPLVSANGMAVLPPGAVLAVLPSTPIMLQASPSPKSSATSSTPQVSTNATLQMAAAEGKLLLLDPRSLPGLLTSGTLPGPLASGSIPVTSLPTQGVSKANTKSPVKTASAVPATRTKSASQSGPSETLATSLEPESAKDFPLPPPPARPAVDVPNFLFDKMERAGGETQTSGGRKLEEADDEEEWGNKPVSGKVTGETGGVKPKTLRSKKKPKRGPPPSSKMCNSSRIKSMMMMTSPGVHTMVSLNISSTSIPLSGGEAAVTTGSTAAVAPGDATSKDNTAVGKVSTTTMEPGDPKTKEISPLGKKVATAIVAPRDTTSKDVTSLGKKVSTTILVPVDATSKDNTVHGKKVCTTILAPGDATSKNTTAYGEKMSTTIVAPEDATSKNNTAHGKNVSAAFVAPGDATSKDNTAHGKKVSTTIVAPGDTTSKGNAAHGKKVSTTIVAPGDTTSKDTASFEKNISATIVAPGDTTAVEKMDGTIRVSPARAVKSKRDNCPSKGENAQGKTSIVLKVPVVEKRRERHAASPRCDAGSDDDLPLSAVAAKIKDK